MYTLEQFRRTAVPMTKTAFEKTYGITDIFSPKVIAYADGYYILCDLGGTYSIEFDREEFQFPMLRDAEGAFWDLFVWDKVGDQKHFNTFFVDMVKRYCEEYKLEFNHSFENACKLVERALRDDILYNSCNLHVEITHNFIDYNDQYNHLNKPKRELAICFSELPEDYWTFIEENTENYSSSQEIAFSNDLTMFLEEREEMHSESEKFIKDKINQFNTTAKTLSEEIDLKLYNRAVELFNNK